MNRNVMSNLGFILMLSSACLALMLIGSALFCNHVVATEVRAYREILPENTSISVTVITGDEVRSETLALEPMSGPSTQTYRNAVLRWTDENGRRCFTVIREKEANPQWFRRLMDADGRALILPDPEKAHQ